MKRTIQSLLFSSIVLLTPVAVFADDELSLTSLKQAAEKGGAQAQMDYGKKLLDSGNQKEASIWIKKAAKQDLPEAIFYLGYAGMSTEKPEAYYYEQAAQKGYVPAFDYVFDSLLFRAADQADVKKVKMFADLARKKKIDQQVFLMPEKLKIIDICYKAGRPDVMHINGKHPGVVYGECKAFKKNKDEYKACLFKRGNNIDIATLYANGEYVKQDFSRAIAYVCHGSKVPAELTSMVETLHQAAQKGSLEEPFSYCDHVASRQSEKICAGNKKSEG